MNFQPSFLLKNRHLQTIYASFFRKLPSLDCKSEIFELSDGDFVEACWYTLTNHTNTTPVVILFHGLAGSHKSIYIQGMIQALHAAKISCVVMHFRGCSGMDNRKARSYHSGDTHDAAEFIQSVKNRYPHAKLGAIGYSLGANMLLKYLGETQKDSLLNAAVGVSAPMQLALSSAQMNRGFSRFYQKLLLKDLRSALEEKYEKYDMQKLIGLQKKDIKKLKNFKLFDEAYTAKINGFESAEDYYKKSSAKQFLNKIETPTLIIHAKDDPFMTPEVIPTKQEVSPSVQLKILDHGGHVGFISGTLLRPKYWLEEEIIDFLQPLLSSSADQNA
ncbi:hydrolase [Sulfurimonas paralvinellae]|uniref:Hydrolase n=1 Tax=Sulfurimonas paralvinellae TaxID=317658 RepID=A0A7M1B4V3_9BACT|nr:hydrolase [Sulfurimonas paralvinellae]QOP44777.1 hydrolase [Sulfurimonas paralvinellae]